MNERQSLRFDRAIIAILAIALALRVSVALASVRTRPIIDMVEYEELARHLARGEGYRTDAGPTAYRPPLYPAFIAAVHLLLGESRLAVRLAQAVLGTATCFLVFVLGSAIGGSRCGRLAALVLAVYPTHVLYTSYVHREILYTCLLMGALAVLTYPGAVRGLGAGALLGLATLTNGLALAVIPVAGLYLAVRRRLRAAVMLVLGSAVIVAPWLIRNYTLFGAFAPVNTKTGVVLWEGNNEGWLRGETEWDIRTTQWSELEDLDELTAHRHATARAMRFIRSNPAGFAYLCWRRFLQFWRVDLLFFFYLKMGYWGHLPGWLVGLLSPLLLLPFPALAVAGIVGAIGIGRPRGVWLLILLVGAVQVACGSLFVGGFRYHFPVIPILAVGSTALRDGVRRLQGSSRRRIIVGVVVALACFNWVDQAYANRNQIRRLLGLPGGRFDDHLTRSWMKRGIF
jgi:4-amino-4-deoxy-L-arabinose transferase-like glycosyltransferase